MSLLSRKLKVFGAICYFIISICLGRNYHLPYKFVFLNITNNKIGNETSEINLTKQFHENK